MNRKIRTLFGAFVVAMAGSLALVETAAAQSSELRIIVGSGAGTVHEHSTGTGSLSPTEYRRPRPPRPSTVTWTYTPPPPPPPVCTIAESDRWGWGTDAYDGSCCDRSGVCQVSTGDGDGYVEHGVDIGMDLNDPND